MWAKSLFLSALVAAGAAAGPIAAGPRAQIMQQSLLVQTQGRGHERGGDIRPLREVVEEIRSQFGGELISARLEDGGRPIYVLRWRLPNGEVRDFRVDAAR
jgi:uncharacterized membrane protein YkoI